MRVHEHRIPADTIGGPMVEMPGLPAAELEFMRPAAVLQELAVLSELARDPSQPQKVIASRLGLSPVALNRQLRLLQARGDLRRVRRGRAIVYLLTDQGVLRQNYLCYRYRHELLRMVGAVRLDLSQQLARLARHGIEQLIVVGPRSGWAAIQEAAVDCALQIRASIDERGDTPDGPCAPGSATVALLVTSLDLSPALSDRVTEWRRAGTPVFWL